MPKLLPSELSDEQIATILTGGSAALDTERIELLVEDTGPGKFEGNQNPGLAAAIYDKSLEGWNDADTGDVEWGFHVSLLGRFLLVQTSLGFVALEEYASTARARREFDSLDNAYAEDMATDDRDRV